MRELLDERDRSSAVKQSAPILVIVGNPPYNAFAGVSPAEEQGLVDVYKVGLVKRWGIKKFNLDDLYVRFFRMAAGGEHCRWRNEATRRQRSRHDQLGLLPN